MLFGLNKVLIHLFVAISLIINAILTQYNLRGLFEAKVILVKQHWHNLTSSWEYKWVHAFPKSISPKVNVIAGLKFKLAYYDVQHFSYYATNSS